MSPSTSSSPNSDRLSLEEEHDRDRSGKRRSFSGWGKKICNPSSSSSTSPSSSPKVVPLRQDIFAFDTTSVSSFSSTSTSTSIFKDTPVLIPPSLPAAKDIPISPILRPPGQTSSTTARLMWEEGSLLRREKGKGKEEIGEDEDPAGPVSGVVMETSGFVCKCQRVLGIVYASFMAIVSTIVLLFVPVKLYFHRLLHRLRLPALPSSPQTSASQSPLLRSPSLKRKPNFESRQMRVDVLPRDVASDEELHELTTSPLAAESFHASPTAEDQPVSPISPSGRRSFFGRKKEASSPPKAKDPGSSCSLCSTKSAKGPCRHIKMQQLTLSHAAPDLDGGLSLLPHSSLPLQQRSFSTPISARPNTWPNRPELKSVVSAPTPVLKLIPDTPPRTAISLRESLDIPPIIRERSNEDMSPTLTPILASPSISEVPPTPTEEKEKKSKLARCKSKRRSIFSRSSTASSVETAASSSMGTTASSATTITTSLSISPRSSAEGSRSPRHSVDGERLVGKEEKAGLDFSGQSNLSMSHF